jgi:hypothetical protein
VNAVFSAKRSFVSFERLGWFGAYCIVGAGMFAVVGIVSYGSYLPLATRFGLCVTGWNLSLGLLWLGTITFVPAFAAYVIRSRSPWRRLVVAAATAVCVGLIFPFQFGFGQCWPSRDKPDATSWMIYVVPFERARMYDVDDPSLDWDGAGRRHGVDVMIGRNARTEPGYLNPEIVSALKDRSTPPRAMRIPRCIRQSMWSAGPLLLIMRKETSLADPLAVCLRGRTRAP